SPQPLDRSIASLSILLLPNLARARSSFVNAALGAGLHLGPGAGAQALELRRHRLVEEQALAQVRRRIDSGVLADLLVDQIGGQRVGIGVGDRVADRGYDF